MKQKSVEQIIVGAALTLAASALLPIVKTTIRPIAISGIQGAKALTTQVKSTFQRTREELEDIVAEAKFERLKKQLDHEIASLEPKEGGSKLG
ncbi:MAG: hypothetical protein JWM44_3373 [Bacilli bacterium]|jgi:hypothetical protein|nr:hypothetical protein [Bacilli bacterium]